MIHYYPLSRAIGNIILGAVALFVSILLMRFIGVSILLLVMAIVALYIGIKGVAKRKKEPMIHEVDKLTFYRRGSVVEVNRENIEKIFYNTKGIDKRVSILTKDQEEIDIPVVYGLAELVKKLNNNLGLG